ncbi:MAG: hypothetical protein RIC03_00150 [Cyclobacteriaceae bacterium]
MFDSLNNFYRWGFNEEMPTIPEAKFIVHDTIITFKYPPTYRIHPPTSYDSVTHQMKLKRIGENSFQLLHLVDSGLTIVQSSPEYIYERSEYKGSCFAEVYIYYLTEKEKDSLVNSGISEAQNEWDTNMRNFEELIYAFEYSLIPSFHVDSSYIVTRDTVYDKFTIGNYGVIYYRNDSTWIRTSIPTYQQLESEFKKFFPFVNLY